MRSSRRRSLCCAYRSRTQRVDKQLFFYLIGNSYQIKSPPGRIALRRIGIMSQKRPAAGGESCEQDSF